MRGGVDCGWFYFPTAHWDDGGRHYHRVWVMFGITGYGWWQTFDCSPDVV